MSGTVVRVLKITAMCIVAVLIVAALLYYVPWPTKVSVEMAGIEVTADGSYKNECTIHLEGWKLNYLFRDDTAIFDARIIGIGPLEFTHEDQSPNPLFTRLSDKFDYIIWDVYSPEQNHFVSVAMCLSKNADWLVVNGADRYFVASADTGADLQVYWEMCADQLR